MIRDWKKLHSGKLHDVNSLPNTTGAIKSRRMRMVGHVARMGKTEVHIGFWSANLKE